MKGLTLSKNSKSLLFISAAVGQRLPLLMSYIEREQKLTTWKSTCTGSLVQMMKSSWVVLFMFWLKQKKRSLKSSF